MNSWILDPERSSVAAHIDASSIDMGNERGDYIKITMNVALVQAAPSSVPATAGVA